MKNILFCCLISLGCFAQSHLSTPLEIMSFMESSPTKYQVEQRFGEVKKRYRPVLANGTFIQVINNREYTIEYEHTETCQETKFREKALEMLNQEKPNYTKIRKQFLKLLETSPENGQIHTYIAETYLSEKNYSEAKDWFLKALALNHIDYSAHKGLAEIFMQEGEIDSAIFAICQAHLYNRNNPLIIKRLKEIFEQKEILYYENWGFDPHYKNYKDSSVVIISADGIWLTYAMYKAVWDYEPDYLYIKSKQEVTDYLFHKELEATLGTYMTYSVMRNEDKRHFPSMKAFEVALDNELLEEYVMYEVLLVDHPTIAAHMTNDFMDRLINYIIKVRGTNCVAPSPLKQD